MIVMITNTIVPYCYDIAHVIGLPAHLSHRFRYLARWIKLDSKPIEMKGRDALIVLRNFATGELIPVRYVGVEDVLTVGEINYIEFRLAEYFTTTKGCIVSEKIKEQLVRKGFQNEAGKELECLVLEVRGKEIELSETEKTGKEHEKWSQILKGIGQLDCYKEFGFLKVHQLLDSTGTAAQTSQDETGKYSFALKPSCLYFLDIIQHVPWEIDKQESIETPYDVELKAEKDEVVILRKIQRVVGKYDLLRFIFKTPGGYTAKHTFLEVENKQGGESAKYGLPALFLPLVIRPPMWMRVLLTCKIVLGGIAVIAVIGSEVIAPLFSLGADWVRTIALLVLVMASGKWDEFVLAFVKEAKEARVKWGESR